MKNTMKNTLRPGSIALGLGLILTTLCQAQSWSHEQSLGGNLLGPPAVAQIPGSDTLQVFYEGGDRALWTRWRNPDGSWSGEQSLGGQLVPGATPFAIQIPNTNYLYVFYRGVFNYLAYNLRDNNGNWLGEQVFGGQIWGNPVAVQVPGTDQVEVFYRGYDGNLKTQWGNLNFWVYEQDLGGQIFGPTCNDVTNDSCYGAYGTPAVIQIPNTNDLYVAYRAPDNTLRYRLRDPTDGWLAEGNVGGHMSSDPSVTSYANSITLVYRGAGAVDGQLMYQGGNLDGWSGEQQIYNLPARLSSYSCSSFNPPSGCQVSYSAPKIYNVGGLEWVFYRGPGVPGTLFAYSINYAEFVELGSHYPITDPIAAAIPGTNTIQAFYVENTGTDNYGDPTGYLGTSWYPN